ncbi:hypothetical protein O6H91_05G045600 [Diphasiastrum complanatum]|uniref:Uncharacterized protein n=1 Tax=Diphasiastrum complanatum TaxID=34168 RepID=A0ACC2DN33_DIPCM|nr:hypothetical protein O6H91_05G045600 [Diphasiastrum complanatum]
MDESAKQSTAGLPSLMIPSFSLRLEVTPPEMLTVCESTSGTSSTVSGLLDKGTEQNIVITYNETFEDFVQDLTDEDDTLSLGKESASTLSLVHPFYEPSAEEIDNVEREGRRRNPHCELWAKKAFDSWQ